MTVSTAPATKSTADAARATCRRPPNPIGMLAGCILIAAGFLQIPFATEMWPHYYRTLYDLPLDEFFSTVRQIPDNTFVIALAIILWIYHRPRFYTIAYLLLTIAIGSAFIGATKVITGRVRPEYSVQMADDEYDFLVKRTMRDPKRAIQIKKADQWMFGRPIDQRPWFGSPVDSFPSGHAFGGAVIGIFLIRTFPAARVLWFVIALGVALSRVRYRRHWPEDTMVGAGIGIILANLVFSWSWPYAVLARFNLTFGAEHDMKIVTLPSGGRAQVIAEERPSNTP